MLLTVLLLTAGLTGAPQMASASFQQGAAIAERHPRQMVTKISTLKKLKKLNKHAKAVRPVRVYRKTTRFMERSRLYGSRGHSGIDLAAPRGTSVYAAQSGRVTFAGWDGAYGRKVTISHAGGVQTIYGHLNSISVKVGQRVTTGQRIGRVGTSGRTTGPHLHFEVRKSGHLSDPSRWLRTLGVRI